MGDYIVRKTDKAHTKGDKVVVIITGGKNRKDG